MDRRCGRRELSSVIRPRSGFYVYNSLLRVISGLRRGEQDEKSASIGMRECRRMRDEGRA
jgi:hypothetical protein